MTTEDRTGVDALADVERELVVLLRRARGAAGQVAREIHPELEPATYGLLVRIADAAEARVTELAEYFGIDKASVSRQVRTLERLGFVARERDPDDARAVRLVGTDAGLERLNQTRVARRERLRRQLDSWDPSDVERFADLLARFNATVDFTAR